TPGVLNGGLVHVIRTRLHGRRYLVAFALGAFALFLPLLALAAGGASWPTGGPNSSNTRSNDAGKTLNPGQVGKRGVKWANTAYGEISATPAVVDGAVYVPDWGGYLNKINAATGVTIWSKPIAGYEPGPTFTLAVSRASPAVSGGKVYLG